MYFNRITLLKCSFPSLVLLGSCHLKAITGPSESKPNIIIILADDLGWSDVGYNGATFYETPNIDRLASEGMILNRFYPSAATSAPSRACLLTGMYSPRHGVYIPQGLSRGGDVSYMRWKVPTQGQDSTFNTFHVSINNVESRFESLAEMLKKSGYISARLGKWHIGDDNQGFDVVSANGIVGDISNVGGDEERYYDDIYVAEKLTDAALDFIEANQNNTFFLYLCHWEVHTPMAAHQDRIEYFSEKLKKSRVNNLNPVYAAEIEQIDISVGRILQKLEKLKLEKNSIVIFTSDNGGLMDITSNLPLRAGKGTFYEGGIRVPFCIRWPGVIKPGTKTDCPVIGVDFMPTLAEIAGAEKPRNQPVDGISFLPLLRGEHLDTERPIFFHFPLYLGGGKAAILPAYNGKKNYWRAVPSTTIISGNWKLIYYYEYDNYELFNLKDDISEQNDLSSEKPEIEYVLLEKLNNWIKEVNAPVPSVINDKFQPLKQN
ncbi:MAG TPA: sulfatase [Bacteroidales bacterium]|nr:sulfatase [Bacteroidales bacterium]HOU03613.1 sulfatase [Bacteroidales bacterium]